MSLVRILPVVFALFLAACGGGGGDSASTPGPTPTPTPTPAPTPAPPEKTQEVFTGAFIDSPVQGLHYSTTSGHSGTTNQAGEYDFEAGDSVIFKVGDLALPEVTATEVVTPLEIMASKSTRHPSVVNLIRLLQSLDEDGDSSNGIVLSETLIAKLNDSPLNAEDISKSVSEFEQLVASANIFNDEDEYSFISQKQAIRHFEESLNSSTILDSDADGVVNADDTDDDNDGTPDTEDMFPWDETEFLDFDLDGIGDNADNDDDNDGVEDNVDAEKRLVLNFDGTLKDVTDYVFDMENQQLFVISEMDKSLTVIDINTAEALHTFTYSSYPVKIRLSPDKQQLYVATNSLPLSDLYWEEVSSSLVKYDIASMEELSKADFETSIYDFIVTEENLLLTSPGNYDTTNTIWDAESGEAIAYLYGTRRLQLSYDQDEQLAYARPDWGYSIYTIDMQKNSGDHVLEYHYTNYFLGYGGIWEIPESDKLLTDSGVVVEKGSVSVTGSMSVNDEIESVAFDTDNNTMLLQFEDDALRLFNTEYLEEIEPVSLFGSVKAFQINKNYLYYLSETGTGLKMFKSPKPCPACGNNTAPTAEFSYTPQAGTNADEYTFDGTSSSDAESELKYRWDVDGDGLWDTEFSSSSTLSYEYFASGTYLVTLEVKDAAGATHSKSKDVVVTNGTWFGSEVTDPIANSFSFYTFESVLDATHNKVYLTDDENTLWIIDAETGVPERYFDLPFYPDNLTISHDKNYVYLSLEDYQGYYGSNNYYIVVFDTTQQAMVNVIEVDYWVEALSGSGDLVFAATDYSLKTFNVTSGEQISSDDVGYIDQMLFNADGDELWVVQYQTIGRYQVLASGLEYISERTTGDVYLGGEAWLTPDGDFLINDDGSVIRVSDFTKIATLEGDISYIHSLTFDPAENIFFATDNSYNVYYFSTESWQQVGSFATEDYVSMTYIDNGNVKVLTSDYNDTSLVTFAHPCLSCGENTAPVASLSYSSSEDTTNALFTFDASASTDAEDTSSLLYRWDMDKDGEWDSPFSSTATQEYRFILPATYEITVQVKDEYGLVSSATQTVEVAQGINEGIAITDADPEIDDFALDFVATDVITDVSRSKAYMTDRENKKLYIVNTTTGEAERTYDMPLMVERMTLSEDSSTLYVTMLTRSHSSYWWEEDQYGYVAIFDLTESEYAYPVFNNTLYVPTDPYDLVESQGTLTISSGSGQWTDIYLIDANDGTIIDTGWIRQQSNLTLHPSGDYVFAADTDLSPSDFEKFAITSSSITSEGDSPYHGSYYIKGKVWVTPDGTYLISAGGDVFLASDMTFVQTLTDVSFIKDLVFDEVGGLFYLLTTDSLKEFSLTGFTETSSFSSSSGDHFIFTNGNELLKVTSSTGAIEVIKVPMTP